MKSDVNLAEFFEIAIKKINHLTFVKLKLFSQLLHKISCFAVGTLQFFAKHVYKHTINIKYIFLRVNKKKQTILVKSNNLPFWT